MTLKLGDFMFKDKFVGLTDVDFELAREVVETMFYGVQYLWAIMPKDIAERKRRLCMNYLLGWQLLTQHPDKGRSISSMGAIPLTGKAIDDVKLNFASIERQAGGLTDLTTNAFGIEALLMIQSAPETFQLQA